MMIMKNQNYELDILLEFINNIINYLYHSF